jgi:hypothetical protein
VEDLVPQLESVREADADIGIPLDSVAAETDSRDYQLTMTTYSPSAISTLPSARAALKDRNWSRMQREAALVS